ncbi:hypothetical protein GCM10028796_56270 [Ramlibacter monticola]|uniref:Uncharacterized protein n=1 Tax=Ramlibacter monticola TaxID=1926872 RepID=A0A937CVS3_9BURK|nr:hypothetical protein [Ramlibacter monticola]MBL0395130.1 hypothetical protein [Ramlibacter monticola]
MARPPRPGPRTDDWQSGHWPYTMPSPEAKEGGQSLWELWHSEKQRLDAAFAPTRPSEAAPLAGAPVAASAEPEPEPDPQPEPEPDPDLARARRLSADLLMTVARRNNRVCPREVPWTRLYESLGGRRFEDLQPPPGDGVWPNLSFLEKRVRFREHMLWAQRHGRLRQVALFVQGLAEGDWVHVGEE